MFRRGPVRSLRTSHASAALEHALAEPVVNALGGARLRDIHQRSQVPLEFSVVGRDDALEGVLWHGVNLSPLSATARAIDAFADHLLPRTRRASSIVGRRADAERLWSSLEGAWADDVREYRWSQPLLLAGDGERLASPTAAAGLRPAAVGEEELVFPASVAMFREEVGSDPLAHDGGRGYRGRVAELIRQGRTYVVVDDGRVVFKADVGALFGPVAQIHGVWVDPAIRGRGLGRAAMSELVPQVRRDHVPQVSLYVNDFNEPARRAYAAAGFAQVGELSTVLF